MGLSPGRRPPPRLGISSREIMLRTPQRPDLQSAVASMRVICPHVGHDFHFSSRDRRGVQGLRDRRSHKLGARHLARKQQDAITLREATPRCILATGVHALPVVDWEPQGR